MLVTSALDGHGAHIQHYTQRDWVEVFGRDVPPRLTY